jgi:hypothetical protein
MRVVSQVTALSSQHRKPLTIDSLRADIRARDSGYLAHQHRLMLDYVRLLRDDSTAVI